MAPAQARALGEALLDGGPDLIELLDKDGRVVALNRASVELLGAEAAAAIIGQPAELLAAPGCAPAIRAAIAAAVSEGRTSRFSTATKLRGEPERWWDTAIWPTRAESDETRVVMSCREITTSRAADIELRGQTRILRGIAEGTDLPGILAETVRLVERLLPGTRACVLVRNPDSGALRLAAHRNLPPALAAAIDRVRLPAPSIPDFNRDGAWAPVHDQAQAHGLTAGWLVPLRAGGQVVGALAAWHGAAHVATSSELARAESCANLAALALEQDAARQARADAEAHFHTVAEMLPGYMYVTAPDGKALFANTYIQSLTRISVAQLEQDGWRSIVHPADIEDAAGAWSDAVTNGKGYEIRCRLRAADGAYRWHLGRVRPHYGPDGALSAWVGVTVDIDDLIAGRDTLHRYRAELEEKVAARTAALQATASELQAEMARREAVTGALEQRQTIEALGLLTASVAHDFNNLLSAIMGSFQLIERRTAEPAVLNLTSEGVHACERAASLVRHLLAVARHDPPRPVVVETARALPLMRDLVRQSLHRDIALAVTIPPDVWPMRVDPAQLQTALLNLAQNARDAMPDGGVLRITAENCPPGAPRPAQLAATDYVLIRLEDTGTGMTPEVMASMFEPFFTTKPPGEGTGLGMAMVRSFIQQAAGDIVVESDPCCGTVVSLYLPRAAEEAAPQALLEAPTHPAHAATLLVVDDDDAVRGIAASFLRDAGYTVLEAGSGRLALALLQAGTVDLLLSDLSMPGMNGVDLAEAARAAQPGLPVVFVTGYAEAYNLEGEMTLQKPYGAAALIQAIATALGDTGDTARQLDVLLSHIRAPMLRAACQTWRTLRGTETLPGFGALTLASRPWSDNCFVVAVDEATTPPGFIWITVGPALPRHMPYEEVVPNSGDDHLLGTAETYRSCTRNQMPLYETTTKSDGTTIERLLLPATSGTGGVTHLVGVVAMEPW